MNSTEIVIEENKNTNSAKVSLIGKLTIIGLEKIIPKIKSTVDKFTNIEFAFQDIEEIDLPGIQLLYSLKKTPETANKNIKLNFDINSKIKEKISKSGFKSILN